MGMYDRLRVIVRPIHVHGVATAEAYEQLQRSIMAQRQTAAPALEFPDPWDETDGAVAFIAGGKWMVRCSCGNAPSASPEWDVARCLECGAVFHNIIWPEDHGTIESILVVRPASQRAWIPPETTEDLRNENLAAGLRTSL